MSLFRCHQLLVPLLLAVLFAASRSDDSYNSSMCLRSHRCGNVNISYPFYLSNEMAALRGEDGYCGYPGLGIQCNEDNQAVLQDNYRILGINNFTVTVVDQEAYQSCPRVDRNLTLLPGSWRATSMDYLLFFLNCSPDVGSSINIRPNNCDSFGGLFVVFWGNEEPPEELPQACQSMIKVPVLQLPNVSWTNSQWTNGGYDGALRRGFNLEWDQGKDAPCDQCEKSNGKCGYNKDGEFKGCLCPDGRVHEHDLNCTTHSSGKPSEA